MKATLHFPTEQYGFAEVELEVEHPHEAVRAYQEAQNSLRTGEGLPSREWNAFLDTYLGTGKPGALEAWERMDDMQKHIVNEIKKCLKRINK